MQPAAPAPAPAPAHAHAPGPWPRLLDPHTLNSMLPSTGVCALSVMLCHCALRRALCICTPNLPRHVSACYMAVWCDA